MAFRLTVFLVATTVACGEAQDGAQYTQVVRFDSAMVRVIAPNGVINLRVELAESREQRTMGLMERQSLADSAGMLFLYPQDEPATAGFWMYRTRIPLDIAFIDSTGVIVATRSMQPCTATIAQGCPTYSPGVPYRAALEVSAGVLARHGITAGTRLEWPVKKAP